MSSIGMFPIKFLKEGWILTGRETPRDSIKIENQVPVPGDKKADPEDYFKQLTTICDGILLQNIGFIYISLEDYEFLQSKMPGLLSTVSADTAKDLTCPGCGQLLPDAFWCAKCGPIKNSGGTNDIKSIGS